MKRINRLRPSRSMAIAFAALFVALTGTAIADKAIDGGDVQNNSITGKDIKNFSLLKKDFKRGQLPAGPAGPQGPAGAAGRAGRDGFGQLAYTFGFGAETTAVEQISDIAECPAGTFVVGGGALATSEVPGAMAVNSSFPIDERTWGIWVDNNTLPVDEDDFRGALAFAVCANANTVSFPLLKAKRPKFQK